MDIVFLLKQHGILKTLIFLYTTPAVGIFLCVCVCMWSTYCPCGI